MTLALTDPSGEVQQAAAARIDDPALLARLVVESANLDLVLAVVGRIDDQELLGTIATSDRFPPGYWSDHLRAAAVARLDDQGLLGKLASSDPSDYIRTAALARLTDPSALALVVASAESESIFAAALGRIETFRPLVEVCNALRDRSLRDRRDAAAAPEHSGRFFYIDCERRVATLVDEGTDPTDLAFAACSSEDTFGESSGGMRAVHRLEALHLESELAGLAADCARGEVRQAAIRALSNPDLLAQVSDHTRSEEDKQLVMAQLEWRGAPSTTWLLAAVHDPSVAVRSGAVRMLMKTPDAEGTAAALLAQLPLEVDPVARCAEVHALALVAPTWTSTAGLPPELAQLERLATEHRDLWARMQANPWFESKNAAENELLFAGTLAGTAPDLAREQLAHAASDSARARVQSAKVKAAGRALERAMKRLDAKIQRVLDAIDDPTWKQAASAIWFSSGSCA